MTREESIIELGAWLATPPGRYLLAWEQQHLDEVVADAFGFHSVQLGLPELDGLRANRMPHRWLAGDAPHLPGPPAPAEDTGVLREVPPGTAPLAVSLHCEFDALPWPDHSIDLVVLPHTLELARDPHQTLREVERVLVPEGRVVIVGFNPASLWGLRQSGGRLWRGLGFSRDRSPYLPRAGEFIGYWRLRDWMRLLGFEVEIGRFGCWRPPLKSAAWLDRFAWIERVGDRWWPVLGAVYLVVAVKHVRGMRLVGLARQQRRGQRAPQTAVANRSRDAVTVERR